MVHRKRKEKLTDVLPGFWQVMAHFWPYTRQQRLLIGASMTALVGSMAFRLLEPWPLKFVIDHLIPIESTARSQPRWVDQLGTNGLLALAAGALVLFSVMRAVMTYVADVGLFTVASRAVTRLRNNLYEHLQSLSLAFHRRSRGGDLVIRVTRDVNLLSDVISTAVVPLVASLLMLLGMVGVMLLVQWRLTLVALCVIPLFWVATVRIGRRIREAARKQRRREGAMAAIAAEAMGGMETVQALSLENIFADQFANGNRQSQREDLKASRLSSRLGRTVDIMLACASAVVLAYGAKLVTAGQLTPGELLVFLAYLKQAFKPAQNFAKYTARLAKATAAGERVIDLLNEVPDVRDSRDAVAAPELNGDISLHNVTFEYHKGQPVLREVNCLIPTGTGLAIVGPSGIGKSTFVSLLARLYDPNSGVIAIDGRDIRQYTLASLRRQLGIVPQETVLFASTARENIACGNENLTMEQIEDAAKLANAHEFIVQLPNGYDTIIGERGATLSRGQRQRIAIARAAVRQTPILILDEPTTGLDEANQRVVIEALERLMRGRTVVLVTHDLQLARRMDRINLLQHGRIVEEGSHCSLMEDNGAYAKLYRAQLATNSPLEELSSVVT
jgi:ATP-binding cassette subfamily B protein